MSLPEQTPRQLSRAPLVLFVVVFAVDAALAGWFARTTSLGVFAGLSALAAWALLAALAPLLQHRPAYLRHGVLGAGSVGVIAVPAKLLLAAHPLFAAATDDSLRLGAVLFALLGFLLHFTSTYGRNVTRDADAPTSLLVPLAQTLALVHIALLAALLFRLYAQRNFLHVLERIILGLLVILAVEAMLQVIARLYQPQRLRSSSFRFGASFLLPAVFGEATPFRSLAVSLEKTFGMKLGQTWLVALARGLGAPLALAGTVGLWLCTAVTSVPIDSQGVLVQRGAFSAHPLHPGLHWHAPWPWARVIVIPTERVQELSLGFERDLAGPVLWAEKHFEGEQNLLVGRGQELLTINVPIHFRIRNAVTFLRRTADVRAALEDLGYRELLALTTTHSAFGLMTSDRVEISQGLRDRLQQSVDHLDLGVEIVFVGLKDVHPPVPVAPAYQEVVSAEEQRVALVDQARSYAVDTLAAAKIAATHQRMSADTAATQRVARAHGETSRFLAPLATYHAMPQVYVTRVWHESLENALADLRQLILVPAHARRDVYLGFDAANPTAALIAPAK